MPLSSDMALIQPAPTRLTHRPSARAPPLPPLPVPPTPRRPRLPAALVCSPAGAGWAVNPLVITPRASPSPPLTPSTLKVSSYTRWQLARLNVPSARPLRPRRRNGRLLPARLPSSPSTPRRRRPGLPPNQPGGGGTQAPPHPLHTPQRPHFYLLSSLDYPPPLPPTPCGRRTLAVAVPVTDSTSRFTSHPGLLPPAPPPRSLSRLRRRRYPTPTSSSHRGAAARAAVRAPPGPDLKLLVSRTSIIPLAPTPSPRCVPPPPPRTRAERAGAL